MVKQMRGKVAAAGRRGRDQRDRGGRDAAARIRPRASSTSWRCAARSPIACSPAASSSRSTRRAASCARCSPSRTCSRSTLNIADPVIGGMANERVALRRAIALAFDVENLVKVVYAGQALPANQLVPPRRHRSRSRAARRGRRTITRAANALLDRFGYGKRDPDGYRRAPDGKPLTLSLSLRTAAISREIQTQWKKDMDAIGLRIDLSPDAVPGPDQGARSRKVPDLYVGGYGGIPSGYGAADAALRQGAAVGQHEPVQVGRIRPRDGRVPAQRGATPSRSPPRAGCRRSRARTSRSSRRSSASRTTSCSRGCWAIVRNMFQTYWKYLDIDLARQRQAGGK